jgi:hypothetical protein
MAYVHAEIVREILSADGKVKVDLLKRHDGLYEFRGYVERIEEGPFEGDLYWFPVEHSGLYETKEEVERAALAAVPGLGLQNPN